MAPKTSHRRLGITVAGPDTSAPKVRKSGPWTATKSQSMSTHECTKKSAAPRASASHTRVRSRRRIPITAAATTAAYKRRPTMPVSLRNCSGTE